MTTLTLARRKRLLAIKEACDVFLFKAANISLGKLVQERKGIIAKYAPKLIKGYKKIWLPWNKWLNKTGYGQIAAKAGVSKAVKLTEAELKTIEAELDAILSKGPKETMTGIFATTEALSSEAFNGAAQITSDALGAGIKFELRNPAILEALKKRPDLLVDSNGEIMEHIRPKLIQHFYVEKKGPRAVAPKIKGFLNEFYKNRAVAVARTECAHAQNLATFETFNKNGIEKHTWIATLDDETRDAHRKNHNKAVKVGQPFPSGQLHPGDDAGDPGLVVNCRCRVAPKITDWKPPDEFWSGE